MNCNMVNFLMYCKNVFVNLMQCPPALLSLASLTIYLAVAEEPYPPSLSLSRQNIFGIACPEYKIWKTIDIDYGHLNIAIFKKNKWKLSLLFRQLFCLDVNIFNRGKDLRRFIQCNKCRSRLHIHYWQKGPGCILLFDHESPVKYFKFLILLQ